MYRLNSQTGSCDCCVTCDVNGLDHVTIICPFEHQDTLALQTIIIGTLELIDEKAKTCSACSASLAVVLLMDQ